MNRFATVVLGSFSWLIVGSIACHKSQERINPDAVATSCSPPAYLTLVVLDQQGTNLIHAKTDQISTLPVSGSPILPLLNNTFRLRQNSEDTTRSTKYGGMGWAINSSISTTSVEGQSPVNRYKLQINGQLIGEIYCSLLSLSYQQGCYSRPVLRFNDQPIVMDTTVIPFAAVIHL